MVCIHSFPLGFICLSSSAHLTCNVLVLLQSNSYNSCYLADKLEIGNSAAMAYGVKRNPLLRAKSSIASITHKMDDLVRYVPE